MNGHGLAEEILSIAIHAAIERQEALHLRPLPLSLSLYALRWTLQDSTPSPLSLSLNPLRCTLRPFPLSLSEIPPMDCGTWAEPHAAPPPVRHYFLHLYYAPTPHLHQPQPSSSTAAYYSANPNSNHYPAPLPSAAGAGALRLPAVDSYGPRPHLAHGGYDGLHAGPYSYPGAVPPQAAAAVVVSGVGAPSAYYYREAVRQYGVDPHGHGPVSLSIHSRFL